MPTHIEFAILDTFDNLEELARAAAITSGVKVRSTASALKVSEGVHMIYLFVNSLHTYIIITNTITISIFLMGQR